LGAWKMGEEEKEVRKNIVQYTNSFNISSRSHLRRRSKRPLVWRDLLWENGQGKKTIPVKDQ